MDDDLDIKVKSHASKRGCIGCLVVFLIVSGALAVFVYFDFHPRDRVQVAAKNIPIGTRFLCFVAEKEGIIKLMDWSPHFIFPGRMAPDGCIMSYRDPDDERPISNRYVMWEFGDRYGVVTRRTDRVWRISWFDSGDLPLEGRGFLLGEGSVQFDLSKGRTEQMNQDLIRRLGFHDMHWADEK